MLRKFRAAAVFACLAAAMRTSAQTPDYRNRSLPVERRVADLLSRMSLEEKVAQTHALWKQKQSIMDSAGNFAPERAAAVLKNGMGQVTRPCENKGPREMAEFTNAIQKYIIENTRLGIPVMFHEEALHGEAAPKGTHFPQAIALSSTWNPALVERVFTAVAREVRARGAQQVLMPVLDLARDPRWGRVEETYGEDPYLVGAIGTAVIRGLQGAPTPAGVIDKQHVIATLKHFAAHGQPEGGTNIGPANYSERVLREEFLKPFQTVVEGVRPGSLMPSYNEIDGIPSHVNTWLLDKVLRGEWGFTGFTVSDYFAIAELVTIHHVATDKDDAARQALEGGVDIELPDIDAYATLADQVKSGKIRMEVLDRAVARILRAKFLTGLFDDPYTEPALAEKVTNSPEHRALARETARGAMILLKNDGGLLPFDRARLKSLAVIGPNANKVLLGGYSDNPGYFVTVLDGVKAKVESSVKVLYSEGCQITAPGGSWNTDVVKLPDPIEDEKRVTEAVAVAGQADAVLLVLGGNEEVSREAYSPTHLGDMDTLELLGRQNELAEKIVATGKPVAVLLLNGRPYSIAWIKEHVPSILEGWYLGQETGNAVADVVFGDYNPAGRMPVSVARNVGQLPVFYNHKPSAKRGYLFAETSPLFPFGWGLSYTTFKYSNVRVEGTTAVAVDVTNTGARDGDEVVQMYLRDDVSSVTRPVKELHGFDRIHLKAGETRTVRLPIIRDALGLWNREMKWLVEPGTFTVMVGGNSVDTISTKLDIK